MMGAEQGSAAAQERLSRAIGRVNRLKTVWAGFRELDAGPYYAPEFAEIGALVEAIGSDLDAILLETAGSVAH